MVGGWKGTGGNPIPGFKINKWQPITDLGDDPQSLTEGELESLRRVWADQKNELIEGGTFEEFDKRLRREWAIETGVIENVYTLDRGVTRTLIEKGIDAALIPRDATNRDTTLVARIIQDHYDALEGMLDFVGGQRTLSTGYVKQLHAALLRNQDSYTVVDQLGRAFDKELEKGKYKGESNSPTRPDGLMHEYCPPDHVAAEMDRLISMHQQHEARAIAPEVGAAWLHHRFTQIHPFADGNGRVARAIASLVFIKAGWFPVIVNRDDNTRYIEALEEADEGDLRPLVAIFVEMQRNAVIQATEVAYEVKPVETAHDAVLAARDRLSHRGKLSFNQWHVSKETANELIKTARQRFGQISQELTREIASLGRNFEFPSSGGLNAALVSGNRGEAVVRRAGHVPLFQEYDGFAYLTLRTDRTDVLILSFHAIGPRFRGIIGIVAYLVVQGSEPTLIQGGTFQINYAEDLETAKSRFSNWLEHVIVEGLTEWRRTL